MVFIWKVSSRLSTLKVVDWSKKYKNKCTYLGACLQLLLHLGVSLRVARNVGVIMENLKLAEGVGCTLSSDRKWLLLAEISSQGGTSCSIWLIWLQFEEPLYIVLSVLCTCIWGGSSYRG